MSIIFWGMTLILLVKYQLVVLSADDHGEGMPYWPGDPPSLCNLDCCFAQLICCLGSAMHKPLCPVAVP